MVPHVRVERHTGHHTNSIKFNLNLNSILLIWNQITTTVALRSLLLLLLLLFPMVRLHFG